VTKVRRTLKEEEQDKGSEESAALAIKKEDKKA
jgi:hypothetical protein